MKLRHKTILWVGVVSLSAAASGHAVGSAGSNGSTGAVSGQRVAIGTLMPGYTPEQMELNYQRACIRGFMQLIGGEEDERLHPSPSGSRSHIVILNYSKLMGISESEEKLLRIILYQAWNRDVELSNKSSKDLLDHASRDYRSTHPDWMVERKKELALFEEQHEKIYDSAIADLRTQFGEADYKRANSYIMRISSPRRAVKGEAPWYPTDGVRSDAKQVSPVYIRTVQP